MFWCLYLGLLASSVSQSVRWTGSNRVKNLSHTGNATTVPVANEGWQKCLFDLETFKTFWVQRNVSTSRRKLHVYSLYSYLLVASIANHILHIDEPLLTMVNQHRRYHLIGHLAPTYSFRLCIWASKWCGVPWDRVTSDKPWRWWIPSA